MTDLFDEPTSAASAAPGCPGSVKRTFHGITRGKSHVDLASPEEDYSRYSTVASRSPWTHVTGTKKEFVFKKLYEKAQRGINAGRRFKIDPSFPMETPRHRFDPEFRQCFGMAVYQLQSFINYVLDRSPDAGIPIMPDVEQLEAPERPTKIPRKSSKP